MRQYKLSQEEEEESGYYKMNEKKEDYIQRETNLPETFREKDS